MASEMKDKNIYLNVQRYVMIFVGKWFIGFNNKTADTFYKIYTLLFESYMVLFTQQILISIFIYRSCQQRVIELACYYIQYTNSYMCSFLTKRSKTKKAFNYILDYERNHLNKEDRSAFRIYLEHARLNRNVIFFFIFLTNSTGIIWYILVIRNSYADQTTGICSLKRGINFQIWYPFDLYNRCYLFTLTTDVAFYITAVTVHIFNKITPITFMIFVLGQIKILQNMIRYSDEKASELREMENSDPDKATLDTINNYIMKHQEIINLMHLVDNACKEIVLISFFSNSLELAAFIIKLITETSMMGTLRTIGILFMLITQIFMFFWYANEIQVQSVAVSDVIYNETDWLNYGRQAKKHLLLVMTRAQRPLTCNAAAIGDMSIDTFKRLMKLCYSITTFFLKGSLLKKNENA